MLIELLSRSRGLISFDPMTNLMMEAANIGVPVFLPGDPFDASAYRDFPADLTMHVSDDPGQFMARVTDEGRVRKLSPVLPCSRNADAVSLLRKVILKPEASDKLRVDQTLQKLIVDYRNKLLNSSTIQTYFDGAALSSLFMPLYLKSMKQPYWSDLLLCRGLYWIDILADLLARLGLFKLLQPVIQYSAPRVYSLGRPLWR